MALAKLIELGERLPSSWWVGGERGEREHQIGQILDELREALPALRKLAELEQNLDDAAMLIRRLCYRITNKHSLETKSDPVVDGALDWLKRKGLSGSVLRDPTEPAPQGEKQ